MELTLSLPESLGKTNTSGTNLMLFANEWTRQEQVFYLLAHIRYKVCISALDMERSRPKNNIFCNYSALL
jgi:hypothetical protein